MRAEQNPNERHDGGGDVQQRQSQYEQDERQGRAPYDAHVKCFGQRTVRHQLHSLGSVCSAMGRRMFKGHDQQFQRQACRQKRKRERRGQGVDDDHHCRQW